MVSPAHSIAKALKIFLYELNFSGLDVSEALDAIGLRSHPKVFAEGCAEVALVEEAGREGDLRQRDAGALHERESVAQTASRSIFSGRATEYPPERACEVDGMNAELLC